MPKCGENGLNNIGQRPNQVYLCVKCKADVTSSMWDKHWVMIELCRVSGMFITLVTSRKFCWEYVTSVATPHYCRISLALLVFTAKIYTLPQSQVTPLMMRNPCFGKLTNGILTHQKMLPWKWNLSLSFISQKWFFMMTWAEHNCFLSRLKCPWKFWCAIFRSDISFTSGNDRKWSCVHEYLRERLSRNSVL